jgi:hypothetical protein
MNDFAGEQMGVDRRNGDEMTVCRSDCDRGPSVGCRRWCTAVASPADTRRLPIGQSRGWLRPFAARNLCINRQFDGAEAVGGVARWLNRAVTRMNDCTNYSRPSTGWTTDYTSRRPRREIPQRLASAICNAHAVRWEHEYASQRRATWES